MRIVSLMPSATEILCALGLRESLVGISHECDHPAEICHLPRVTRSRLAGGLSSQQIHRRVHASRTRRESLYTIETNRLAALAPDLVVTQRQCSVCAVGEADAAAALAEAGSRAQLVSLAASRFEQLPHDIRKLGEATSYPDRAEALVAQMEARLEHVRRRIARSHRRRVFCLSWFDPLMAAGHWMTKMVALAGGQDGLGTSDGSSAILFSSILEAYAPEIVLLLPCGFTPSRTMREWEIAREQPFWSRLPAMREGRVFIVDGSLFHRPGPRLVEGVELLAALLHPKRCGDAATSALVRRVA